MGRYIPVGAAPDVHRQVRLTPEERGDQSSRLGVHPPHVAHVAARVTQPLRSGAEGRRALAAFLPRRFASAAPGAATSTSPAAPSGGAAIGARAAPPLELASAALGPLSSAPAQLDPTASSSSSPSPLPTNASAARAAAAAAATSPSFEPSPLLLALPLPLAAAASSGPVGSSGFDARAAPEDDSAAACAAGAGAGRASPAATRVRRACMPALPAGASCVRERARARGDVIPLQLINNAGISGRPPRRFSWRVPAGPAHCTGRSQRDG